MPILSVPLRSTRTASAAHAQSSGLSSSHGSDHESAALVAARKIWGKVLYKTPLNSGRHAQFSSMPAERRIEAMVEYPF